MKPLRRRVAAHCVKNRTPQAGIEQQQTQTEQSAFQMFSFFDHVCLSGPQRCLSLCRLICPGKNALWYSLESCSSEMLKIGAAMLHSGFSSVALLSNFESIMVRLSIVFVAVCFIGLCAAMPNFKNVFFEADFFDGMNAGIDGHIWWDPVNLRARVDEFDHNDKYKESSAIICNHELDQIEGYRIIDNMPFNFTFCKKYVMPSCTFTQFSLAIGKMSGYLNLVAEGVGISLLQNGTSDECTFQPTERCLRYSLFTDGCNVSNSFQWIIAQANDQPTYYPQVRSLCTSCVCVPALTFSPRSASRWCSATTTRSPDSAGTAAGTPTTTTSPWCARRAATSRTTSPRCPPAGARCPPTTARSITAAPRRNRSGAMTTRSSA